MATSNLSEHIRNIKTFAVVADRFLFGAAGFSAKSVRERNPSGERWDKRLKSALYVRITWAFEAVCRSRQASIT